MSDKKEINESNETSDASNNEDVLQSGDASAAQEGEVLDQNDDAIDGDDLSASTEDAEALETSTERANADNEISTVNRPSKSSPPAKGGRALASLALLLALAASGLSGFLGWKYFEQQRDSKLEVNAQREQTRSVAASVDKQFTEIAQLQSATEAWQKDQESQRQAQAQQIQQLKADLEGAQATAKSHARRLLSLTATTTDDWRLAEVEYLLRLANQRLLISSDVGTSSDLLEAADSILLELGDPRLLSVRRAIAEDKSALALVADVDLDGMFLELAAIASQVDALPVVSVPRFEARAVANEENASAKAAAGNTASTPAQDGDWLGRVGQLFKSGWLEMRSWLVINRPDAVIKPLLPPEQQYYLRSNLKLLLNQAQIALLEKRQQPYRSSLDSSIAWLEDYFPASENAVSNTISSLQALANIDISPDVPDVSASLLEIKSFVNQRFSQAAVVEAKETSSATDKSKNSEQKDDTDSTTENAIESEQAGVAG